MRRFLPFPVVLVLTASLFLFVASDSHSQPKEFRRDAISGGAEASLRAPRVADTSGLRTSPAGPSNATSFVPGIGFLAYNYDDNIAETGGIAFIPPDPCGAAGPDRVIAVVNVGIECRDKAGALIFRDALRDFFSPLGPQTLGTLTFDPKVVYDHYEGRFVVVALERWTTGQGNPGNESRILVAVSRTPAPATATAADWRYLAINSKINIGGTNYWADYPGFEVDEEAVYITANMYPFSGSGVYSRLWIIDKGVAAGFYAGGAPSWAVYDPIPAGFFHMTLMPALVFGAGGVGPGIGTFLVGYSSLTYGGPGGVEAVQVIRVDNPLGAPTFTGEFVIVGDLEDVGGIYGFPGLPEAPQLGTTAVIAVGDTRTLDAVWRNNSLWFTASIRPNGAYDPVNAGQTTAHWFRLDTSAVPAPIALADQGNVGGEDIAFGTWTFFPAVAVNRNGDAKFGFAASAQTIYCGAYFAGREATDPPGTVQPAGVVQPGLDYYLRTFGAGRNRWGDYSGASVDPLDDTTFWVFNEYAEVRGTGSPPEDGRWGTAWRACMVQSEGGMDFGDLPDPPYPTLLAGNGARHVIVPNVYMGARVDAEPDGQPLVNANGDDVSGADDEDGVISPAVLIPSALNNVTVTVSADGWLDAWYDFNLNGNFLDPGEQVYSAPVPAGANMIAVWVPVSTPPGSLVYARFRYNLGGPLGVDGPAPDGEVEDYRFPVAAVDFGDAPDPMYPTLLASNGGRHLIVANVFMGGKIDGESDGQPHPNAQGDDLAALDDEDGVSFTTTLDPTHVASVDVTVSTNGFVDAWVDFNGDGAWSPAEQILASAPAVPGVNSYSFNVPGTSRPAFTTFARFRFSTSGGLQPDFMAFDGEVEDYEVQILKDTVTGARNNGVPERFALFEAVPNPFNPQTTLSFALPSARHVQLTVYDVRGHLVTTLLDEDRSPGVHEVVWDGRDNAGQPVASGVYLYRIKAGGFTDTRRMVLVK